MTTGRVLSCSIQVEGSALAVDHTAGPSSSLLTLEDTLDFVQPEYGENLQVQIIGDTLSEIVPIMVPASDDIDTVNYDTGTIQLATEHVNSYEAGDMVEVYPRVVRKIAQVRLDDAEEEGETIDAVVPSTLYDKIADGVNLSISVDLDYDGEQFTVEQILGDEVSIDGVYLAEDSVTVDKLSVGTLSAITADLGTVTAGSITGITITGTTITGSNFATAASGARRLTFGPGALFGSTVDQIAWRTAADTVDAKITQNTGHMVVNADSIVELRAPDFIIMDGPVEGFNKIQGARIIHGATTTAPASGFVSTYKDASDFKAKDPAGTVRTLCTFTEGSMLELEKLVVKRKRSLAPLPREEWEVLLDLICDWFYLHFASGNDYDADGTRIPEGAA